MRGRRRGRNRPSPPSPPSAGSAASDAAGGQGAVKLLDASDSNDDVAETVPVDDGGTDESEPQAPDAPEGDRSVAELPDEPRESPEEAPPSRDEVVSPTDGMETAATPSAEASVGVGPTESPTSSGGSVTTDEITPETSPASPSAAAEEPEKSVEPTGRQPQAASGNPLPRVLAVANQKGGVGKTTTSVNLGAALAELGFRVLVIDLDPQGNATTGLGIDARNFELSMYDVLMRDSSLEDCVEPTSMKNLFVAPATIALAGAEIELVPAFSRELKLKRAIESVIDDFDFVLIDCPPSLGLITVNALAAADEVLVPIQCEYYALEGLSQLMRNVHLVASNLNPRLDISTIVLTMYDARTKLADQVATEVRDHFGNKVCRIVIPRTVRLSEAPSFGQPITAFDPASRGAIAYRELAKEVSGGTS